MKQWLKVTVAVLCILSTLLGLVACQTPTEEPPAEETPPLDIVKGGVTQYQVVRNDLVASSSPEAKAAVALRVAIKNATGCDIGITTDYDKDPLGEQYEILVGNTNRPEQAEVPADLGKDEFVIMKVDRKIIVYGGSDVALDRAVNYFVATYLYGATEDQKIDLSLPSDIAYRGTFDYPATVYLINDIRTLNGVAEDAYSFNDIARLITSLQGCLNRNAKENDYYIYWMHDTQDSFWLDYISGDGKMLEGTDQITITDWNAFWNVFGDAITAAGIVSWDPDVPATSNVAATVCGVDGFLPVRYSEDGNSLYQWLLSKGVKVKMSLVDKFTGEGTIPDTNIPSSGSIKCDPYLWALDQYIEYCHPTMLAYVLDGASCIPGNHIYDTAEGTDPNYNQLYSHDYYIYNRCFFVDLTCVADEIPCDDPDQPMGTDAKTLGMILNYYYENNQGNICTLMGFPPWYMKYTVFHDHGKTGEVELEWAFVDFISQYNFLKEADAAQPAWMTNASVYCQYESTVEVYENNEPEYTEEFDENVRYFTVYIGDYDSSAWLKLMVPTLFESHSRGQLALMWPFNPNLSDRVPMIFDYVYENATENDYFCTGDSGAGYVFPSAIEDMDAWIEHNMPYMDKFDMDIVGFIINGTRDMTEREYAAYAEIAPVGSFVNGGRDYLVIYDETPFLRMCAGDANNPQVFYNEYVANCGGTNFGVYRIIRNTTEEVVKSIQDFEEYANARNDGYTYKYVDPYTLFDLILQSGQGRQIGD